MTVNWGFPKWVLKAVPQGAARFQSEVKSMDGTFILFQVSEICRKGGVGGI